MRFLTKRNKFIVLSKKLLFFLHSAKSSFYYELNCSMLIYMLSSLNLPVTNLSYLPKKEGRRPPKFLVETRQSHIRTFSAQVRRGWNPSGVLSPGHLRACLQSSGEFDFSLLACPVIPLCSVFAAQHQERCAYSCATASKYPSSNRCSALLWQTGFLDKEISSHPPGCSETLGKCSNTSNGEQT